jgi:hypothetical protein
MRPLRRVLQQIVLAGLSFSLASCVDGTDRCKDSGEQTFKLETPADPPIQFRIDSCRIDVDACDALCALTLQRALVNRGAAVTSCKVELRGDTVFVKVGYDIILGGPGCPIEDAGPPFLAPPQTRSATTGGSDLRDLAVRAHSSPWENDHSCHA